MTMVIGIVLSRSKTVITDFNFRPRVLQTMGNKDPCSSCSSRHHLDSHISGGACLPFDSSSQWVWRVWRSCKQHLEASYNK